MKTIILSGGLGTRLAEETSARPKPMIEIGGRPMVWHIMNIYACQGCKDFIVACGYKAEIIKEYFSNFMIHNSDFQVNLKTGHREILTSSVPDWNIAVVDTGHATLTGGRLLRLKSLINEERFMVTYGDGVADVNVKELMAFHKAHGKRATVTAVPPPARFGALELEGDRVSCFLEKSQHSQSWINGGFFVFEPSVLDYIEGDNTSLEREPLERLAAEGELMAFRHAGFWQPMDTLRDKLHLENLWSSGRAPWKIWR